MNEIATYTAPVPMPLTAEHGRGLLALASGKPMSQTVTAYTQLLPVETLQAMRAELAQAMKPTTADQAAKWARILVNSFPAKDAFRDGNHAKVFAHALAMDLAKFPQDIVEKTVHKIRRENGAFIPGAGEVYRAAEAMMGERQTVARVVALQIAEHERRKVEAAKPKPRPYSEWTDEEKARHEALMSRVCGTKANTMPGTTKRADGRTSANEWEGITDSDIARLREEALRGLEVGQ